MSIFRSHMRREAVKLFVFMVCAVGFFIFALTLSVQFKFVRNDFGMMGAVWYALQVLPVNIYTVFPVVFILSVWLFFYRLHTKGALMHIFASGISPATVGSWLLMPWCIIVVCMVLVGECAGPLLEKHAKKIRMQAMLEYRIVEQAESLWLKEADGFTEVMRTRFHKQLVDLKRYVFNDEQLEYVLMCSKAQYVEGQWQWDQCEKITIRPKLHQESVASYMWVTRLTPQLLSLSSLEGRQKPLYKVVMSLWTDRLGIIAPGDIWLYYQRLFNPVALALIVIGMTYGLSRVMLMRLERHTLRYALIIATGCWFGISTWSRLCFWLMPEWPLLFCLVTSTIMVYCIYYVRQCSMQWLDKPGGV